MTAVCVCERNREKSKGWRGWGGVCVCGVGGMKWETDLGFLLKRLPKPHHSKACLGANLELI